MDSYDAIDSELATKTKNTLTNTSVETFISLTPRVLMDSLILVEKVVVIAEINDHAG